MSKKSIRFTEEMEKYEEETGKKAIWRGIITDGFKKWQKGEKIYIEDNVSLEKLDSIFLYMVIAIIIGARIGHFLFYDTKFLIEHPLEVLLPIKFNPFRFTSHYLYYL